MYAKIILNNHPQQKQLNKFPVRYSISTIWTFDGTKNKHEVCKGEDCIKKFCESLREHAMKIINFEIKKVIQLKTSSRNQMKRQKSAIFTKTLLDINTLTKKIIVKLKIIVIIQANTEVLHIA